MISLIFLPIVCSLYLKRFNREERVIEIVLPSKYDPQRNARNSLIFDTTVLSLPENKRHYTIIDLDSNDHDNKEKLKSYNDKVCKLISTNDTVNAIHLRFGKGFRYGDFIEAINISNFNDATVNHFIIYDNNLWYLYKNVNTQQKIHIIKRRQDRIKDQNEFEKNRIMERTIELNNEPISKRLTDILKVWPCLIAFLILVFFSIRSMIKK